MTDKPDYSEMIERLRTRAESYRLGGPSSEHTAALLDEAAAALAENARLRGEQSNLQKMRIAPGEPVADGFVLVSREALTKAKDAAWNLANVVPWGGPDYDNEHPKMHRDMTLGAEALCRDLEKLLASSPPPPALEGWQGTLEGLLDSADIAAGHDERDIDANLGAQLIEKRHTLRRALPPPPAGEEG